MRAFRKFLSIVLAIALSLPTLLIPQDVKAAEAYLIADTILDFSKNGSYTFKLNSDDIDGYIPVHIGKKGVISVRYEVSDGCVAFIEALDDVTSTETKQFKIPMGDDYVDYDFYTFVNSASDVSGFETFSYQEEKGETFYLGVTVFISEIYQIFADNDNTWGDTSAEERDRLIDEQTSRGKEVTITWEFTEIGVDSISLDETDITLATSGKLSKAALTPVVKPEYATNTELVWSSSNTKVAKVSDEGVVTAVGKGKAKITAKTKDGSGKKVVCKVQVVDRQVSLAVNKLNVGLKESATVAAKVIPAEKFTWKVKDGSIASVSKKGVIKGKKTGTTTVYIETATGKKASCKVTVFERKATLSKTSMDLNVGTSSAISAKVSPSESFSWYSDDETVAVVDGKGNITGVNEGTTSVYVVTASGKKSGKCTVKVKKPAEVVVDDTVKSPVLSVNNKTVYKGNTIKVVLDSGTEGGTWKCSSGFAIVSSGQNECILKANSSGICTVTYTVGGKSAVVNVEVVDLFG